jgi:hypothetical protein
MSCPVMLPDSSESRKSSGPTRSSGTMTRWMAWSRCATTGACAADSAGRFSDRVPPGASVLTRSHARPTSMSLPATSP